MTGQNPEYWFIFFSIFSITYVLSFLSQNISNFLCFILLARYRSTCWHKDWTTIVCIQQRAMMDKGKNRSNISSLPRSSVEWIAIDFDCYHLHKSKRWSQRANPLTNHFVQWKKKTLDRTWETSLFQLVAFYLWKGRARSYSRLSTRVTTKLVWPLLFLNLLDNELEPQ
jgi:hypothetical protein